MRYLLVLVTLMAMMLGCAHNAGDPITPMSAGGGESDGIEAVTQGVGDYDGPYRLWGEWTFYIDETHEKIDVVPRREGRFHLNALKFLEEYCTNCLEITKIKNNGDSTIDLTVKISHPFTGFPEYTGFDVKGIIMFNCSYEYYMNDDFHHLPIVEPYMISWCEMGDPQVLNPDGYAYRWSPTYESGSDMPIFNYWSGKYSNGLPNASINAYLNFYSNAERHVFMTDSAVSRTYTIWLPLGEPVIAGYAVEACWEPPVVTPVKNPLKDFPITANQPEPYFFKVILNNGEGITHDQCCVECDELKVYTKEWDDDHNYMTSWYFLTYAQHNGFVDCDSDEYHSIVSGAPIWGDPGPYLNIVTCWEPKGNERGNMVFDLVEFTIIEE